MKKGKGFFTVELAICILVALALMFGTGLYAIPLLDSARAADTKAKVAEFGSLISQYRTETGAYPTGSDATALKKLCDTVDPYGPWVLDKYKDDKTYWQDSWEQDLKYGVLSDDKGFYIYSKGPNNTGTFDQSKLTFSNGAIGFCGR